MYRHIMVGVDAIIVSMKCFVGSHGTLGYESIKEDISVPRYICVTKQLYMLLCENLINSYLGEKMWYHL